MSPARVWIFLVLSGGACGHPPGGGHGHSHGAGGHDHGEGGAAHAAEEGVSLAVTRWTATHELFVELDAPVAGQAFAYHAHVTRMADNHPATAGSLTIRFDRDGLPAASHTDDGVARPGIFAKEGRAPAEPGVYALVLTYADGEERAVWDAGTVTVGGAAAVAGAPEAEGEIAFLKEAQWQVPFRVAPAARRAVAPVVVASGVVRPAPASTAVVAAPADGLLVWSEAVPVVGRGVSRGDRLGTLLPAGAAEHWATLQAELRTARVDRELAAADVRRVEGLTDGELVSARRIDEVRAALARAEARVVAAEQRLSALSSGDLGAIPVRAPATGVLVAVGAEHGVAVRAGDPLVTVAAGDGVVIEARVFSRAVAGLHPVASLTVSRGGQPPLDLAAAGGVVLTEHVLHDPVTLSAPLVVAVPAGAGLRPGERVEVAVGVGGAEPAVAVPRSAVVEINGQDFVFVQISGESFTRRRVVLGDRDATHVVLTSGVEVGEMVVVEGGFDVHVASLSGALESHTH